MTALLIVEDNAIFADTLVRFLNQQKDLTVVAVASTAEAALEMLPDLNVDLMLVDVSLPTMSGIELVMIVRQQYPDLRCLMVSGHNRRDYIDRAMAVGAQGYVLKENPFALLEAMHSVIAGETSLSYEDH